MKTSLEFLPAPKQRELQALTHIICEKYPVEMVILFGSYARGDWVEELGEVGYYNYQSDFDIFCVTKTKQMADKLESDPQLDNQIRRLVKTPISIIAHDIDFFNRRLRKGQYFFSDIKKEGILLYDSGRSQLVEEKNLSPKEYQHLAKEDFDYYLSKAEKMQKGFLFYFNERDLNEAAFLLHQTTEKLYDAILLVMTRYKPKAHDLKKLGKLVSSIDTKLLKVFPQGTSEERRLFELLRDAYVDSRYNKNYTITQEELTWLVGRVNLLKEMTKEICQKKIDSFGK